MLGCSFSPVATVSVGRRVSSASLARRFVLEDVEHDDGDVVDAAGAVGGADQPVRGRLRRAARLEDRLDLILGDHRGQSVAAEQHPSPVQQPDVLLVDLDVGVGAEGTEQHVAVRVDVGLRGADLAGLHHAVHERVVFGEAAERSGA